MTNPNPEPGPARLETQLLKRIKPVILGFLLAIAFILFAPSALARTSVLHLVFRTEMANTGVDANSSGRIDGILTHQANANLQRLKLTLASLNPSTTYQLLAFIGEETEPRTIGEFTTDGKGSYSITYMQRCPGNLTRGTQPLPGALDPISHIHQLDIVLGGNVVLSGLIGTDMQADCTAPVVISTAPENGATDVALTQVLTATFSEPMNPATLTRSSFLLKKGTRSVSGAVTYAGDTAAFTPTSPLERTTTYTATITTRAKDASGNPLASNFSWSFTTGPIPDTTPPVVSSVSPLDAAIDVAVDQPLTAAFSEAMDASTINTSTFTLTGPGATPIAGAVSYDVGSHTATFVPGSPLTTNTVYSATITTGVRDLAGNALANNVTWSFTTAASTNTAGPAPVVLGAAANFAVLAGSTVTSGGPTILNGDLGLSPGSAVVGFPPGTVNGTQHVTDTTAAQAQVDLNTAYNDAAGRTVGPVSVAGNIGGSTLTPGLYKSTSSLEVSSGDLTLDAQGNANAVFIFQIASTLTATAGRQVILSGGAKAANVYWQVGTSATLATTSVFKGTIMADQSITLATGATLEGRALARIAAVSLDAAIITVPAP